MVARPSVPAWLTHAGGGSKGAAGADAARASAHAASLAISIGANVKAAQRMLGHASAEVTLNVYSDLSDAPDDAAMRLDHAAPR